MLIASRKQFQLTLVLEEIYFKSQQTQFTLCVNASKHEKKPHPFLILVTLLSWKNIACALISNKLHCYDRPCLIMNSKINSYYPRVSQIVSGASFASVRPMKNMQTNSADQRLLLKSINVSAALSASRHMRGNSETQEAANLHIASIPESYPFII